MVAAFPGWLEIYPTVAADRQPEVGRGKYALGLVLFLRFDGVSDVQAQFAAFQAQGLPGDPQQAGGLVLVPPGRCQDAREEEPVHLLSFADGAGTRPKRVR